ncbi:hypothetical protein CHL78_007735 [Romboutsia weinsteinii]|uniref:Mpv17/PMP22 family protein n=1 Tax=Romboutsia weinsteinii TaxID=2020949 RepID=A0A371J570_9FIRM|nr:Mpv17/PMP22 family protein [Romboutsia weinsteinii]RDY27885.1 hypothetical protein CHL78_007735 [Romboutsia weinsteinii]
MKKGDLIWGSIILIMAILLLIENTRDVFILFTESNKLIGGFIKFGVLSTMGEMLAGRITTGKWRFSSFFFIRAIIWGLLGVVITLMFSIFDAGVAKSLSSGLLPGANSKLTFAFLTSAIMNLTFAPTFMFTHKVTDTYLDLKYEKVKNINISIITDRIDLSNFLSFVVGKTIPLFWIPAHTITFLIPGEYRVLFAAILSIALGVLLALGKKSKTSKV